jgi:outer membrane protein assembly factor BamB
MKRDESMDHNDNEQRLMTDIDSLAEQPHILDGVYAPASLVPSVLSRLQPGNASVQPGMQGDQVEQLMTALENSDWHVRATAARTLGELGERTPVEPLIATLNDEDESVRAAAVQALGKLGERAPIDRLVAALHDPEWAVREIAALTLGELGERAPAGPLLDILHAEDEDPFVRDAAKMALQQTHPAVLSPLASGAVITPQPQDHDPGETGGHLQERARSYVTRLIGPFKSLSGRSAGGKDGQEEDNIVEIPASDDGASPGSAPQQPVLARPKRHLAIRIGEGVLAALLIAGLALSWLVLAQKLRPSSPGSSSHSRQAPTAGFTVSPSWTGHDVSLTVVDGVAYAGTFDKAVYALRISDGSLLWRYNTNGSVDEPPLVFNGMVYVSSHVDQGPSSVYALHASDGSLLWRYTTDEPVNEPPMLVNGVVYVSANVAQGPGYIAGYVYALRVSDGSLLWRYTRGNYVNMPTVVNGVAYIGSGDDTVSALRASDGSLLWRYTTKGYVGSSPLVVNGVVYVSDNGSVYALKASDGSLLWRYTAKGLYTPTVVNGVVYVSAGGIVALQASNGTVLWRYALASTDFSPPTVVNGIVYTIGTKFSPETAFASSGGYLLQTAVRTVPSKEKTPLWEQAPFKFGGISSVYAMRASDGALLWHYMANKGEDISGPFLSVVNGVIYIVTNVDVSKNYIYALRGSDGSVLWRSTTEYAPNNALVANGVIYIGLDAGTDGGTISALRVSNGSLLWRSPVYGTVFNTPILVGESLYVGTGGGFVYALQASNGSLLWRYLTDVSE